MANLLIGYQNRADAATLAGGAWTSTLPLNNLKDRQQAKVARSQAALLTFTASSSTDEITTASAHGAATGDACTVEVSGGTLAAPLAAGTVYFVRFAGPLALSLHTSSAGAIANTGKVDLTTAGSGTQSIRFSTNRASARFRADLGASYSCRGCALVDHNLGTAARWRVRLGAAPMDIDFTTPVLDERITLTRATAAWRVNSAGYVAAVASGEARFDYNPVSLAINGLLIEEARTNLFLYSEYFGATWTLTAGSLFHNAVRSPDGLLRGSKFVEDTTAAVRALRQSVTFSASQTYTSTVYALAGERSVFTMVIRSDGTNIRTAHFTLSGGGSVAAGDTTLAGSQRITDAGGGWYRCELVATVTGAPASSYVDYRISSTASPASGGDSYTGNGYNGMYFWGGDVALGAFSTSYIGSTDTFTSRASVGSYVTSAGLIASAAIDVARNSYNPALLTVAPKLLIEPAATNLLLRVSEFDNASWAKTNTTAGADKLTSPDGTVNAETIIHTSGGGNVNQTSAAFSAGSVVTVSVFARRIGSSNFLRIELGNLCSAWFNLSTGAVGNNGAGSGNVLYGGHSMQSYGNGWYRCRLTVLTAVVTTLLVALSATDTNGNASLTNSALCLWGAGIQRRRCPAPPCTSR